MKQIVCLATSPWFPVPTRKQQVMSRIQDAEILYFDPSVSVIAPLKDKKARPMLTAYKKEGFRPQKNITVYSLPPVLPFFNKSRAINRVNQKRIAAYVRKIMKRHGFEKPLLWVYSPVTVDAVEHIPHSALVYDCVDRHSAYGGLMDPALVDAEELELAGKCGMVFATAAPLAERLRAANPKARFIPNGANFERFYQASQPQPVPSELAALPHPIFGFVGALQPCIEYGFVEHAAKAHPEWSFVWIGGEKPGADVSALKALPNCHFLGLKPNEQLPQYLAHFDVCLNLFASGPLSKDVSPLKFYEYLATGKPIVSTRQPDQILQYAPLIHIADTADEFVEKCAEARSDTQPDRVRARIEEGRKSSWDARVEQMCEILRSEKIL